MDTLFLRGSRDEWHPTKQCDMEKLGEGLQNLGFLKLRFAVDSTPTLKYYRQTWSNRIEEVEFLGIYASLGKCLWPWVPASLFSRKLCSVLKKGGDSPKKRMRSQQESRCGFHRAQWLKVNLKFCPLSDGPRVFSHKTVVSPLELKPEFASRCLELQLQVVEWFKSFSLGTSHAVTAY